MNRLRGTAKKQTPMMIPALRSYVILQSWRFIPDALSCATSILGHFKWLLRLLKPLVPQLFVRKSTTPTEGDVIFSALPYLSAFVDPKRVFQSWEKILLVLSILKMSFSLASWVFRKHVSVDSVSTYVLFEMLTSCFIILGWRQKDSRWRIGKIRGKILRLNCCKLSAPKIGRSSP